MPIRTVPETDLKYYLASYDADGRERTDDADGVMSDLVVAALSQQVTDVFILSHGWRGDVPAAINQYDRWIKSMANCQSDRDRIRQLRPGFKSLIVGFHWPSEPWGEEEIGGASFSPAAMPSVDEMIEAYAARIADTPRARAALRTIIESAAENISPVRMPDDVRAAYEVLNQEAGIVDGGEGAAPGDDREEFDPVATYEAVQMEEMTSFGGFGLGGILSPLRQLSFWKMKGRGRTVGESGGAQLLRKILANSSPGVKVHLMGHSFGCIVVSAMLKGSGDQSSLIRPVDSVALIQGALSLWSYCSDIPKAPGKQGYFHSVVAEGKVRGPIVTTQTVFDTAVGRFYPLGAGIARQVVFAPNEYPKYGALGAFGARGPGIESVDMKMLPASLDYSFQGGRIYNLESSQFINQGGGAAGAHNDIAKPEVAHAIWQAAMT
jgi:hypothetical protein